MFTWKGLKIQKVQFLPSDNILITISWPQVETNNDKATAFKKQSYYFLNNWTGVISSGIFTCLELGRNSLQSKNLLELWSGQGKRLINLGRTVQEQ